MATISKKEFEKSLNALDQAFSECEKHQGHDVFYKLFRDATIQRFEFTVEIAWKLSMKTLGHTISSPKPALREMLGAGLIDDINAWFDYIDARNKSSHTYDENIAREVYGVISDFIEDAKIFLGKL